MSQEKSEMIHFRKTNESQSDNINLNIGGFSESDIAARGLRVRSDSSDIPTGYMTGGGISGLNQEDDQGERIRNSSSVDQQNYPVTWLPAMVVSTERSGSPAQAYVIEATGEGRSPSRGMTPGTIIQLPASYSEDSNQNIVGLVVGPNTVVPIDSLSLMNFHQSFAKYTSGGVMENSENNIDSIQSSKFESDTGQGENSNPEMKEEPVFCSYCNKWIKNLQEMQTHFMIEHGWDQGQCNAILGESSNVYAGLRTCPNCGSQLRKVGTYGGDYTISGNEDDTLCLSQTLLMACDNCGKEFTLGPATDNNNQSQQNSSQIDYRSTQTSQAQGKRHYCDHCDKSYKQLRDLRKHVRAKHSTEPNISTNRQGVGESTIIVDQDGSHHVTSEVTTQAPKLMCDICKKMFRGPFELRRHVHTVHENKRPYKCPDCSKLFRDAYELKRHTASHQRLYYHSVASSSVPIDSNSSIDMIHLANVNDVNIDIQSGVLPNSSQILGNSLLQDVYSVPSSNVCSSQTGNAPPNDYFCTACEKNFRGANEFKRHYSVVHEKKYRYKCIHCGKLWRDQYDLKRHCRRSHFIDRDIDKDFIRSCLLDNNGDGNANSNIPLSMAYEIPQQVTLSLNSDPSSMFAPSDIDASNHSHMEQFNLVDPEIGVVGMTGGDISPSNNIYRNTQSQTTASLLGLSKDSSDQTVSWQNYDSQNSVE